MRGHRVTECGRGLVATAPIEEGEVLLSVPWEETIHVTEDGYDDPDDVRLAMELLHVLNHGGDGDEDPRVPVWARYRPMLPTSTGAAAFWRPENIRELQFEEAVDKTSVTRRSSFVEPEGKRSWNVLLANSRGTAYCSATTRWAPAAPPLAGRLPTDAFDAPLRFARSGAARAIARDAPKHRRACVAVHTGRAFSPRRRNIRPARADAREASGWPIRLDAITPVERRAAVHRGQGEPQICVGTAAPWPVRHESENHGSIPTTPKVVQFWRRQTGRREIGRNAYLLFSLSCSHRQLQPR